jgi:hypothetical protein
VGGIYDSIDQLPTNSGRAPCQDFTRPGSTNQPPLNGFDKNLYRVKHPSRTNAMIMTETCLSQATAENDVGLILIIKKSNREKRMHINL